MQSPFPPRCAEKYRATRLLSSGGFGVVYEAVQTALERPVVVKLLHAELLADGEQLSRFVSEAKISATLRHPSIVTLLDHDVESGRPWIAYELVEGNDLREALRGGPLPVAQVVDIGAQICGALAEAHAHGVVHRDIKPENVLAAPNGVYKVTDFGAARWIGQEHHTQTGVVLGTPAYIAPEQLRGEVTARSDLYALGCLLFELLAGRPPYVADTAVQQLSMHVTAPVPSVRSLRPDVPEALDGVLIRALAKDPAVRWQTAGELRETLVAGPKPDARPASRAGPAPDGVSSRALTRPVEGRTNAQRVGDDTIPKRPAAANAPPPRGGLVAGALVIAGMVVTALVRVAAGPASAPASPSPTRAAGGDLAEAERAAIVEELDEFGRNRRDMISQFQLTWDPSPDLLPTAMFAKLVELKRITEGKLRRLQELIARLESERTPWRQVLAARAGAERCHRLLQLKRLRAVEPVMAGLQDAMDKTRLLTWLQEYAMDHASLLEMERMLRDVDAAARAMAARPELARELGYLLESMHAVSGQCAVLIGDHRRALRARTNAQVNAQAKGAPAAVEPIARLVARVWDTPFQHGNAYATYIRELGREARALVATYPAAGPGVEHLVTALSFRR